MRNPRISTEDHAWTNPDGQRIGSMAFTATEIPRIWILTDDGWLQADYGGQPFHKILVLAQRTAELSQLISVRGHLRREILTEVRKLIREPS